MLGALKERFSVVGTVYALSFKTIARKTSVLTPLVFMGAFNALALTIAYMFPRDPFRRIFGPIVIKILGPLVLKSRPGLPPDITHDKLMALSANFLHYPTNFDILPMLYKWGNTFLYFTLGVLFIGACVRMVYRAHEDVETALGNSLFWSLRRYISLAVVLAVPFLISFFLFKGRDALFNKFYATGEGLWGLSRGAFRDITLILGGVVTAFFDALFMYCVPAVVVENRRALRAFGRSFSVAKELLFPSYIIALAAGMVQVVLFIPFERFATRNAGDFPEAVVIALGAVVFLAFVGEILLRIPSAVLFLLKRDSEASRM